MDIVHVYIVYTLGWCTLIIKIYVQMLRNYNNQISLLRKFQYQKINHNQSKRN